MEQIRIIRKNMVTSRCVLVNVFVKLKKSGDSPDFFHFDNYSRKGVFLWYTWTCTSYFD